MTGCLTHGIETLLHPVSDLTMAKEMLRNG
jgi:hypothetical protein